jgi:sporulation protein YqfC
MLKKKYRQKEKSTEPKKSSAEKFSEILELPKDAVLDLPKLEMIGNREVLIENYKGILEYSDSVIKINASRFVVTILGRQLEIKSMAQDGIYIAGYISSIEFI